MRLLDVLDIIENTPYQKEAKDKLARIADAFQKTKDFNPKRIFKVRGNLNNLYSDISKYYSKTGKGKHLISICGLAIVVFKQLHPIVIKKADDDNKYNGKNHLLSAHALCSALGRCGYDVGKLKDFAYKKAMESGLEPILAKDKFRIITFIKPTF